MFQNYVIRKLNAVFADLKFFENVKILHHYRNILKKEFLNTDRPFITLNYSY